MLSSQDVPRLRQLLSVQLKQGKSIDAILAKLAYAIDGTYRAKGYTQEDVDVALLAWRLGGPRLLHVLSKKEGYPSTRTIARKVKLHRFTLSTHGHSGAALKANVETAEGDTRPKVLMVDQIAAEPTLHYCAR